MPEATATLMAHCGAFKVNRGDLVTVEPPNRTLTFTPIKHDMLVNLIENKLDAVGMDVQKAEFALQDGKLDGKPLAGAKMFASFILRHQRDDFAFSLGLRASNDKSMAIELVAGVRVFVCDNMALSGEADLLWRKHTARLSMSELTNAVSFGVSTAISRFGKFEKSILRMKETPITDMAAKANIYDAVVKGVIPQAFLPKVGQAYFEPPHAEFEPRTEWSLHNAYTEVLKNEYATKPHLLLESTQNLGSMFAI